MILRSRVRDCLYLNWALPRSALPDPPDALRYQVHTMDGERWVFASALLFRQQGIHVTSTPWARISYPQLNLRFYTLDSEDVPSVLFHQMWAPHWVVPAVRVIGRQPVRPALLRYPPSVRSEDGEFTWRVVTRDRLEVAATPGSAVVGPGPRLGDWEQTVDYFRLRPRGYCSGTSGLQRIETAHVSATVWPMRIELRNAALLDASLELGSGWPPLHSAWICPELTFEFEVLPESEAALVSQVPATG